VPQPVLNINGNLLVEVVPHLLAKNGSKQTPTWCNRNPLCWALHGRCWEKINSHMSWDG